MTDLMNHKWYLNKYIEGINLALSQSNKQLRIPLERTGFSAMLPKLSVAFLTQLMNPDNLSFCQPTTKTDGISLFGGYSSIEVEEVALQLGSDPGWRHLDSKSTRYPQDISSGEMESPGTLLTNYLIEMHPKLMIAIADIWIFDLSPLAAERDVEIIIIPSQEPTSPDQYREPGVFAVRWTDSNGESQSVGEPTENAEDLSMELMMAALSPTWPPIQTVTDTDRTDLIQEICGATFAETLDNIMLPSRAALSPRIEGYTTHHYKQWFAELNKKLKANGISLDSYSPHSRTINRYSP
jgi:hypothetical protein